MFLFDWLWTSPPKMGPLKTQFKVVEVSSPRIDQPRTDKEIQESLATLMSHPGFLYLISRFEAYRSALRYKLETERHKNLEDAVWLQAGLYWCNFAKTECQKASHKITSRVVDPFDEELAAFKEIDAQIERVGNE